MSHVFNFFALNELKFSQIGFLRFGGGGVGGKVPYQTQEKEARFHPIRDVFAKVIKTEVKVMALYLVFVKQLHR